jgi:potassium efflux system protein
MHSRIRYFQIPALMVMAGLGIASLELAAQQPDPNALVSEKIIEARIQEVAAAELDEDIRRQLNENYRKALGYIETERVNSAKAEAFAQARETAPGEANAVREKLEEMRANQTDVTLNLPSDASARQIEQQLQTEKANEAAVSAKRSTLEQQLAVESNRPKDVRQALLNASETADKLAAELKLPAPPGELPRLTESRRWVMSIQAAAANAEIRMLDQELLSQSARVDLLQAQRDMIERNLGRIEARIVLLEQALVDQRRSETERIIAESDTSIFGDVGKHPLIRDRAQQNLKLSEQLQMLTTRLEQVEAATRIAVTNLKRIEQSFQTARQRLEIAGLSQSLGLVLHEQRRDLPDLRQYRRHARDRTESIAEAGLRDIRLEAAWRELRDTSAYIATRLDEVADEDRDALGDPLRKLVDVRRALLSKTIAANTEFLRASAELDFQENRVQTTADEFDSYLVERLLWVRSKKAVGLNTVLSLPGEVFEFLDPGPWLEAIGALFTPATETMWLGIAVLLSGLLLWKTAVLRSALRATAKWVGRPAEDTFMFTMRALGITALLTLSWPLLTLVAGWELSQSLDVSDGAKAIGTGLLRIAIAIFFLRALKMLCLEGGLGEAHFRWPASATRSLRVQLDRMLVTFVLPIFVLVVAFWNAPEDFGGELGRISFVLATAGLGAFLYRLLRPADGIVQSIRRRQGFTKEISPLWLILGTAIPVIYAIAALVGYLYSAITLMSKLIDSLWLIFGLLIVHELVARWLLVVGGRLRLQAYLERREAARIEREKEQAISADGDSAGGEEIPIPAEEPALDIGSIDTDTRKLVNMALILTALVGLGGIWSSVLPALSIFQEITLWEYLDGVPGQQQLVPVTLANLSLATAYGFVTIVAARTAPSLLEAMLRHRGSVTPGSRLAFATLARYSIILVGVTLIAGSIGFNWGKIQWLVAALGVGIGFGMQEIIANFISGLIILVERPIRVGDLVTVGDTSGTVTRLQIRATTVTNFDRQELLVPNTEFITGRVLNWSLSDEVIRLVARVGVAYGSDMKKALALVREAVDEQELILKEPHPLVTFDEFGDNSLNITARCFIGSLNIRREALSDLNLAINRKLHEGGIVIAFPQRDVHLDMASPLDVRIQKEPTDIRGASK